MRSFDGGPLPPSVYLHVGIDTDVIHVIKWTRPSPSIFAYCKRSKTGRWEGLGTRLHDIHCNKQMARRWPHQPTTRSMLYVCMILASHYLDMCGLVPFLLMLFRFPVHRYTIKLSYPDITPVRKLNQHSPSLLQVTKYCKAVHTPLNLEKLAFCNTIANIMVTANF